MRGQVTKRLQSPHSMAIKRATPAVPLVMAARAKLGANTPLKTSTVRITATASARFCRLAGSSTRPMIRPSPMMIPWSRPWCIRRIFTAPDSPGVGRRVEKSSWLPSTAKFSRSLRSTLTPRATQRIRSGGRLRPMGIALKPEKRHTSSWCQGPLLPRKARSRGVCTDR